MSNKYDRCPPPPPKKSPWLVYTHGTFKEFQTFYNLEEDYCYERRIPDMDDKYTYPCGHGWIFTLDLDVASDDCFLFNPVSLSTIELPPWGSFRLSSCILTLPPDDPNCVVIAFGFPSDIEEDQYVRHCRLGDHQWIDRNLEYNDGELSFPVACNGKIYGCCSPCTFVVLDINGDTIAARSLGIDLPEMSLPETARFQVFPVESRNELFVVRALKLGETSKFRDMEVYRLDSTGKNSQWVKVESLGETAFFIDTRESCSTSCSAAESEIKGNTIYFVNGRGTCMDLYVFDLEDKSITVSRPRQKRFKKGVDAFWIMPNVQLNSRSI